MDKPLRPIIEHGEFVKVTKPLSDHEDLKPFGIVSCGISGEFEVERVEEIKDFCRKNPQFHIISAVENAYINRFIPNAFFYHLALGDSDPYIYYPSELYLKFA